MCIPTCYTGPDASYVAAALEFDDDATFPEKVLSSCFYCLCALHNCSNEMDTLIFVMVLTDLCNLIVDLGLQVSIASIPSLGDPYQ